MVVPTHANRTAICSTQMLAAPTPLRVVYPEPRAGYGADKRVLDLNQPCPVVLRSYGLVLGPCPCKCRGAFNPDRLRQGGVRGFYLQSVATGRYKYLRPRVGLSPLLWPRPAFGRTQNCPVPFGTVGSTSSSTLGVRASRPGSAATPRRHQRPLPDRSHHGLQKHYFQHTTQSASTGPGSWIRSRTTLTSPSRATPRSQSGMGLSPNPAGRAL